VKKSVTNKINLNNIKELNKSSDDENSKDTVKIQMHFDEQLKNYGYETLKPSPKTYSQWKGVLKKYRGLDRTKDVVTYVVKNWKDLRIKKGWKSPFPNVNYFAGWYTDEIYQQLFSKCKPDGFKLDIELAREMGFRFGNDIHENMFDEERQL
tara:strand:+ start:63 stop:518 length:456 start_codon:yes stop_codon:yes gene_type:complete